MSDEEKPNIVARPQCPKCGRQAVLVWQAVPFVIHTRGAAHFHGGAPYGDLSHYSIPDTAEAVCNTLGCDWSGKLRDTLT